MSVVPQSFLPLTEAEQAAYRTYERQRRQQILRIMLPLSAALLWVGCLGFSQIVRNFAPPPLLIWLNYSFLILAALLCSIGTLAIRRQRVTLATSLMLFGVTIGLLGIVLTRIFGHGLDPYGLSEFTAFAIIIVLAGILNDIRVVIGTTILMNLLTLLVILRAPYAPELDALLRVERPYLIPSALVLQWLVAAFLIAQWFTFRGTLRSLGAAYERAQQLDQIKDQFITHVNHELRTPVMAVQSYIEYLRVLHPQLSEAEMDSALERTSQAGTALVTLLENILEVRRIDGQTDAFTPVAVPVRAVVEKALLLVDPRLGAADKRELRVSIPEDLAVWGEPTRCQQMLTNLISNACKYSPPDAPVEVSARLVVGHESGLRRRLRTGQLAPAFVEIQVRDYGLGIPPDQAALLFNRFTRLPRDLASSVEGNGLGLYLCRVMAQSMGGSIWAESSGVSGEGSTFHLRLPIPPATNESA